MKFIIKAVIESYFQKLGFGLDQEKLSYHVQLGIHLEIRKGFTINLPETVVQSTTANAVTGSRFFCRKKDLRSGMDQVGDFFHNRIGNGGSGGGIRKSG